MKFQLKKFIYLVNDITNLLLRRERIASEEQIKKLRDHLTVTTMLLIISMALNIYFYFFS